MMWLFQPTLVKPLCIFDILHYIAMPRNNFSPPHLVAIWPVKDL